MLATKKGNRRGDGQADEQVLATMKGNRRGDGQRNDAEFNKKYNGDGIVGTVNSRRAYQKYVGELPQPLG